MNNRNMALDWLKLAMAVAVMGIHTLPFLHEFTLLSYVLANGIFRVAVPLFLVVTGFYFSRIIENPGELKAWCTRLLLLYAIWMVIYGVKYVPRNLDPANFLRFELTLLVGYWHLWYLVAACLGGAMLYCLRSRSDGMLASIAVLLFCAGACVQYLVAWVDMRNPGTPPAFDHQVLCRNFLFVGFPFLTAGYLIRRSAWVNRVTVPAWTGLLLIGFFLIGIESLENYRRFGLRQPFEILYSLPVAVLGLFMLAQKIAIARGPAFIGSLSIALYLSHPLVILLLTKMGVKEGTLQFLLTLLLTVAISPALLRIARAHPALLSGTRSVAPRPWRPSWRP